MYSVSGRVHMVKQPRGGYVKPSQFRKIVCDDGLILNKNENIHASVIGLAVDYLTRFLNGADKTDAFSISLKGATIAELLGKKKSMNAATRLLKGIKGLDNKSIINACKLVTFDVWLRNTIGAINTRNYEDTNPDRDTINNIKTLVKRSLTFFETYGPIVKDGFTFAPPNGDEEDYIKMNKTGKGNYGGYTPTVSSGDGDFLTSDTLWDFKVLKSNITSKHTLQLLMYWIMGQHSEQDMYKNITKLGVFNPRLNTIYLLDVKDIPNEVIDEVEKDVIGYM